MSSAARHYYHENPNCLDSKKVFINPNERFLPLGLAAIASWLLHPGKNILHPWMFCKILLRAPCTTAWKF